MIGLFKKELNKKITIWDLDFYFAKDRINLFNPDVMKISSYHKQKGDLVNFVLKEQDINRPFDLCYIIKEKDSTPNPPMSFYLLKNIRWWGEAYRTRVNWEMPDVMLAVRPDYLLYPEKETRIERAEHIRLFNNKAKLLPITQDYTNSFKNKLTINTDTTMWFSDKKSILYALDLLQTTKNISFLKPIYIKKLLYDEDIKKSFLKLKISKGIKLEWTTISWKDFDNAINLLKEIKQKNPSINIGELKIKYSEDSKLHWENKNFAIDDFNQLCNMIIKAKKNKIKLIVESPKKFETPYWFIFSLLNEWTKGKRNKWSFLQFLCYKYKVNIDDIHNPQKWNELFRDILRQTYTNIELLTIIWGKKKILESLLPILIWKEEFKYGY